MKFNIAILLYTLIGQLFVHCHQSKSTKTPTTNLEDQCVNCSNSFGFVLCSQPYALCTSAKCSNPANSNNTVCQCDILNGCSMGLTECTERAPYSLNNINYYTSTFNPIQLQQDNNIHLLYYKGQQTFANCLDKLCVADPEHPSKATCQCTKSNSNNYITMGTKHEVNKRKLLSGTTVQGFLNTQQFWEQCLNINIFLLDLQSYS